MSTDLSYDESYAQRSREKLAAFVEAARPLIVQHGIHAARTATSLDAHRISYLLSVELVKLYKDVKIDIWPDSQRLFYRWALGKKLRCNELPKERKGKTKVSNPFPSSYWELYPWITTRKYEVALEDFLFPIRSPIVKRTYICKYPL